MTDTRKRNYGIDSLRILSMYMIVLNHCLQTGGIIARATQNGIGTNNYNISWFMDILCYCAVNCYALISGFVGINARYKIANIIKLWLQVFFYSTTLNVLIYTLLPNVTLTKADIIQMILPISFERYWYFSAYFVLFTFIPFLNFIINTTSRNKLRSLVILLIIVFSFAETFIFRNKSFLGLQSGYSATWLIVLYLIGGYIRLYGWKLWNKNFFVFITMGIISFITLLLLGGEDHHGRILINYPAPTILFMGIALINIFKNIRFNNTCRAIVKILSPLTFGVYLIHIQPFVAKYLLENRFSYIADTSSLNLIIKVILISVLIYIVCSLIEWIRYKAFELMKVNILAEKIVSRASYYLLRNDN